MANTDGDLNNPVVHSLACAAISPGLRTILVFDADLETFEWMAQTLTQMLNITTRHKVIRYPLGVTTSEADLWGNPTLPHKADKESLAWTPGVFTDNESDEPPIFRLITISDLTTLSLSAARACVMLMGNNTIHIERYGRHEQSKSEICWIARCKSSEVGKISSHLLDRFALRLSGFSKPSGTEDRGIAIHNWVNGTRQDADKMTHLAPDIKTRLRQALQIYPRIDEVIADTVSSYFEGDASPGWRREIALARLSIAHARLLAAEVVTEQHVHQAAQRINLRRIDNENPMTSEPDNPNSETAQPPSEETPKPYQDVVSKSPDSYAESSTAISEEEPPVYAPGTSTTFPSTMLNPSNPYPEDEALTEHEAYALQLPLCHGRGAVSDRGPIIGVQRSGDFQDLAIVATILEACKYQKVRRRDTTVADNHILISRDDLRRYRRAPIPGKMLALLIDYTALKASSWQEAVFPYLRWAYIERANLCIVKVGAANAPHELRAERIMVHSVLNPQVTKALDTLPGRATPLAHGFAIAFQTLQHALQHGRGTIHKALLVVLTDGRGNVPLTSSQKGQIDWPVGQKGIEDAINAATRIKLLENIEVNVLSPQLNVYPELPFNIAKVIGAKISEIPNTEEIDE